MELPSKILEKAVENISQLPGIGKRTALRLALHLLKAPSSKGENLAESIQNLVLNTKYCNSCFAISEYETCEICSNESRNSDVLCVVEDIQDVMAIENTSQYKGLYHVLSGLISPIDGVSPQDLNINQLVERIKNSSIKEVIFALNSTIEGDTTAFYIHKLLKNSGTNFSSIARGIGIGEQIEYTDELTLARSIINRIPYSNF